MTSMQPTDLCHSCIAIFDASPDVHYVHYKNGVAGVREAIGTGCVLCAKFWSSLTQQQRGAVETHYQNHSPQDGATYYFGQKDKDSGFIHLLYGWPTGKRSEDSTSNTVTTVWKKFKVIPVKPFQNTAPSMSFRAQNASDYNGACPQSFTGMPSSHSTWSTAEVRLAQFWINFCLRGHDTCQRTKTSFLPSRLIDVGTTKHPIIKLCEGTNVAPQSSYTTLSHTWGTAACFTLEKANLEGMKKLIRHEALPKTVGDAILVTRDLEIQYIWVDSLCIIQDSTDDWARECEVMGSIYAGSYCNIAATAAGSNEDSCIFARDPASVIPTKIRLEAFALPTGESDQVFHYQASTSQSALETEEYAILIEEDVWAADFEKGPLLQRAWVVQERLLAPRSLHFGKRQLGFECNEWLACETYPVGFPENLLDFKQLKQHCSVRRPFEKREDLGFAIDTMRLAWLLFVLEFTKNKLSRVQDKLPAVLGVATQMREAIGSLYVAGLWVDHLLEQLLWRVNARAEDLRPFSNPKQAPSWSWAAVNHRVGEVFAFGIFRNNTKFFIIVEAVEAQNPGMTVYQKDAWIRLRGRLFAASLSEKGTPWHSSADIFTLKGPSFEAVMVTVLPDHLPSTMHVSCLPILASTEGPNFALDGLLLVKVDDEGRYRRIGRFIVELPANLAESYLENLQVSAQSQTPNEEDWESMSSFIVE